MSNFSENFGLEALMDSDEIVERLLRFVLGTGKTIPNYYGYPYYFKSMGKPEYFLRAKLEENGTLHVIALDSHCAGNCIWEMEHTGLDLTEKTSPYLSRVILLRKPDGGGMIPVELITADVYPSFLEGDRYKIQIIGLPLTISYFPDEEAYSESLPKDEEGQTWGVANGSLIASGFLCNHSPEEKENFDPETDKHVHFMGTVKRVIWGFVNITGEGEAQKAFVRCFIDTLFGELEFEHTLDQVDEEQLEYIKEGAIVSGVCVLSGDLAIDEYEDGIIRDHEHDLKLLRYTFMKGEEERLKSVLKQDTLYVSETTGKEFLGPDEIINKIRYVRERNKDNLTSKLATITDSEESLEYGVGTRCFVLAYSKERNYEAIVFIDVDEEGMISRIKVSNDSRYFFKTDAESSPEREFDISDMPDSVEEAMLLRAKAIYSIRPMEETLEEFRSLTGKRELYTERARRLYEKANYYMLTGPKEKIECMFGNLFVKAFEERLLSEIDVDLPELEEKEAFSEDYAWHLGKNWKELSEKAKKHGRSYCKDFSNYWRTDEKKGEPLFVQAAEMVQEIGEAYAVKHLHDAEIEYIDEQEAITVSLDANEPQEEDADYSTELPVEEIQEKEEFVQAVSKDILGKLNEKGKEEILQSNKWELHLGFGTYIRNTYIHGRTLSFHYYDPDDLSSEIIDRIIEALRAEKDAGENRSEEE